MDIEVVDWFFLPPKLRSEDDSVSKSPCHESLLSPIWSLSPHLGGERAPAPQCCPLAEARMLWDMLLSNADNTADEGSPSQNTLCLRW